MCPWQPDDTAPVGYGQDRLPDMPLIVEDLLLQAEYASERGNHTHAQQLLHQARELRHTPRVVRR